MTYKTTLSLSVPQVNFRALHLPGVFSTNIYSHSRRKLVSVPCNFYAPTKSNPETKLDF